MSLRKIGRYEILSEIERGGMATVYYARDPFVDRYVAIKILPRALVFDAESRARFEREARIIATIEHPAIVPIYDYGEDDGQPFLVMRFMKGGSLGRRLRYNIFSLPEARNIITRVAPAIDKVHQLGIVHRDLKPDNILFDEDDHPYIADFGIARLAEASASISGDKLVGTLYYASPEHLQKGNALSSLSDIYAMGVILFEMLTGDVPFKGEVTTQLIKSILMDPVPRASEFNPSLPMAIDALIERAMAKNPKNRHQTAQEFSNSLETILGAIGITDSNGHPLSALASPTKVRPRIKTPAREGGSTLPMSDEGIVEDYTDDQGSTIVLEPGFESSFSQISIPGNRELPLVGKLPLDGTSIKPQEQTEDRRKIPLWPWGIGIVLFLVVIWANSAFGIFSNNDFTPTPDVTGSQSAGEVLALTPAIRPTETPSPTNTLTAPPSSTYTETPTLSPTPTPSATSTLTPTITDTSTPTNTPLLLPTATPTPKPTNENPPPPPPTSVPPPTDPPPTQAPP